MGKEPSLRLLSIAGMAVGMLLLAAAGWPGTAGAGGGKLPETLQASAIAWRST